MWAALALGALLEVSKEGRYPLISANPKLVDAIVKPLLDNFDVEPHPWWWPLGTGATTSDWGLGAEHRTAFDSLTRGTGSAATSGTTRDYKGFLGSLGSTRESCRIWVLTSRPSSNVFPAMVTTRLVNLLRENGWLGQTHVTDVIKFRGPGPDSQADTGLTDNLWELSLNALSREFAETEPEVVLVAGGKTRDWVNAELTPRCGRFPELVRLLERQVHVRSWIRAPRSIAGDWREAVKAAGVQV